jgi:hypothetical protein
MGNDISQPLIGCRLFCALRWKRGETQYIFTSPIILFCKEIFNWLGRFYYNEDQLFLSKIIMDRRIYVTFF